MTDIRAEMQKALAEPESAPEGNSEPEQKAPGGPQAAPGAQASSESPPETPEGTSEDDGEAPPEGVEAKGDGEEGSEKAEKADEPPKEAEKPSSSYQRLQKKHAALSEENKKNRAEASEALVIANEWRQRAFVIAKELRRVMGEAKKHGYSRDVRDDKLLIHEMRNTSQDMRTEAKKLDVQKQEAAEINQAAEEYAHEASSLASKYRGLSQGEILRGYAAVVESSPGDEEPSMEEVAQLLHARKAKASAPRDQMQVNRSAPRPLRQSASPSRPPEFKSDRDGMKAFLKSNALA